MQNQSEINWFIRRQEVIDEFISTGKNPSYLGAAEFDVSRIHFSADINQTVAQSDVLILAIPSPYVKQSLNKIRRDMTHKVVISAVKGMIPEENIIITDYLHNRFGIAMEQLGVIAGPCHAEEIALERLSYLTIGCENRQNAEVWAKLFETQYVHTTISSDVTGLEYSSVMKNIYAIAAGMCQALHYGDNFQAVLLSNAIQEIQRFATAMNNVPRDITASGYLGDVLVTGYSQFSRNRQFGQMLGLGYSVKAAQMEMIAEGYYATKAIYMANQRMRVSLPIVDAMYEILYNRQKAKPIIKSLTTKLQ
jgi:glycerol-3-phosphate dehydrogenase (NAD(P)+)